VHARALFSGPGQKGYATAAGGFGALEIVVFGVGRDRAVGVGAGAGAGAAEPRPLLFGHNSLRVATRERGRKVGGKRGSRRETSLVLVKHGKFGLPDVAVVAEERVDGGGGEGGLYDEHFVSPFLGGVGGGGGGGPLSASEWRRELVWRWQCELLAG